MLDAIVRAIEPQTLQLGLRSGCFLLYFFILTSPYSKQNIPPISVHWREHGWRCISLAIVFFFTPQHIAALLNRPLPDMWVMISSVVALILTIAGAICKNIAKVYESPQKRSMFMGVAFDLGVVGICISGAYIFS